MCDFWVWGLNGDWSIITLNNSVLLQWRLDPTRCCRTAGRVLLSPGWTPSWITSVLSRSSGGTVPARSPSSLIWTTDGPESTTSSPSWPPSSSVWTTEVHSWTSSSSITTLSTPWSSRAAKTGPPEERTSRSLPSFSWERLAEKVLQYMNSSGSKLWFTHNRSL